MKMRIALMAAMVVAVFYCGCRDKKKTIPVVPQVYYCMYDNPANIDNSIIAVADANNEFALDLYAQLKAQSGNLFFSPASISTALAMTYAGAKGQTATEMRDVLRFTLPDDELHPNIAKLVEVLDTERPNSVLAIANALWGQENYGFLQDFLDLLDEHYGAPLTEVDFITATEEARQTINAWVEENTNGKIEELLKPGVLTVLTRLVLTNAIYFKSSWKYQFDPADTVQEAFDLSSGQSVQADMMKMDDDAMGDVKFKFYYDAEFTAIELPYDREIFSMLIFLPNDPDGLAAFEDSLTYGNLTGWLGSMYEMELAALELPKFEFTSEFPLNAELSTMGMPTAFDELLADFTGINGGFEQLYISDVVHKAYVKVNEEGTEAAAATAVIIGTTGLPPSFVADHPFVFMIRHNATGAILFMGRVTDPTQ